MTVSIDRLKLPDSVIELCHTYGFLPDIENGVLVGRTKFEIPLTELMNAGIGDSPTEIAEIFDDPDHDEHGEAHNMVMNCIFSDAIGSEDGGFQGSYDDVVNDGEWLLNHGEAKIVRNKVVYSGMTLEPSGFDFDTIIIER